MAGYLGLAALALVALHLWHRRQMKRLLRSLDRMLDAAIRRVPGRNL